MRQLISFFFVVVVLPRPVLHFDDQFSTANISPGLVFASGLFSWLLGFFFS